ncbi:MAG: hypothetical protein QW292_12875 [Candidatus Parvarchaeota archaeon]
MIRPTFIEFQKNILANKKTRTSSMPRYFSIIGACSRKEQRPKLLPTTKISPNFTLIRKFLSVASIQCILNRSIERCRFPQGATTSVSILSPNRKIHCSY